MPRNRSCRYAFTLLEVILALGLSALLIGVLAMAIQTSMKATYGGRADVAQAQLARAALARIGADLRSAVWYEPLDPYSLVVPPAVSSLAPSTSGGSGGSQASAITGTSTNVSSSSNSSSSRGGSSSGGSRSSGGSSTGGGGSVSGGAGASSSGGMGRSGGGGGSSGGGMGGSGGSGSSSSSSGGSTTTTTPMPLPMFVGGQNWLQVDISHLPRPDQYAFQQFSSSGMSGGNSGANPMAMRDRISEIKTVYYLLAGGAGQALPPGLSSSMAGGKQQGLLRREADRIVTAWTSYGGGSSGVGPAVEALAPEIATLEFKYFNGSMWTNTWDSRTNYSLPRAVEIAITLADEVAEAASAKRPASGAGVKPSQPKKYVLRVPLPAWRPPNLQVLNSMAIQAQQNAASGSSSSSSTSTGAAGMGSY